MNLEAIRKDFPQLRKNFIYFDSGSTSLKPLPVIKEVERYYTSLSTNVGRGLHRPSYLATKAYQEAREKVRQFFKSKGDVIFTKNCTEAINMVSHGLDWKPGDRVITTCLEHNSNLLPWLNLQSQGVEVVILRCKLDGQLDLKELSKTINNRTKLVAVTQASNVLGNIVPVEDISDIAKKKGAMLLVDGAQAAPHLEVNLDAIDCDFYAGSGHKMCGPSGTGFLIISSQVRDRLKPMMLGGGSATNVEFDKVTYTQGSKIYEAGTPNIAGGIGLGFAVEYLEKIGMTEIRKHELELTGHFIDQLKSFKGITLYGPDNINERTGVVSFSIQDIPAHRAAILFDEIGGIAIRSGHHCAYLLTNKILEEPCGTARVSFYLYNTLEEIDMFFGILKEVT